jgi:DNA-binding IclR family transcriptional regulator
MAHSSKKIGAVQRAVDILNLFDSASPELGTTEIAKALGLHKSTAASLVYTLEANGYLTQNPNSRKYRLGFKLLERANSVLDHIDVREIALPWLRQLHDECGETVNLGILDGADVVYIESLLSTRVLGMHSKVGKRTPAHSAALGKAILGFLPLQDAREYIAQYGLPAMTPNTISDSTKFLQELERVREQGFAIDDEENELGGRCVAAPIFDHESNPALALSISVPSARLSLADVPQLAARVLQVAKTISHSLGYMPRPF